MPVITDIKRSGIDSLKITLNKEEIDFLVDIVNNIGGSPDVSRRRISTAIRDALNAAGVDTEPKNPWDLQGNIYFKDSAQGKPAVKIKHKKVVWDSRYEDEAPF